jgi:hypothetical protein
METRGNHANQHAVTAHNRSAPTHGIYAARGQRVLQTQPLNPNSASFLIFRNASAGGQLTRQIPICATIMLFAIAVGYAAQPDADPVIDAAREATASFTKSLPDYIVKRTTTRYRGIRQRASDSVRTASIWKVSDVVTAGVVAEHGTEVFVNIRVNGTPSNRVANSGQWSAGEFSSTLKSIFSSDTGTQFTKQHSATLMNRPAWRYDFAVDQPHSNWRLASGGESVKPAYGGQIWIDKESLRVLRIDMSAREMPSSFTLDSIESTIDYDFVKIGDNSYLLPGHSESSDCEQGTRICFKNVTDFEDYRKYSADTSITFDGAPQ